MAKQHWLVRDNEGLCRYLVYAGARPEPIQAGGWPLVLGFVRMIESAKDVKALLHPDFHLEPGGGPVLLGCW